MIYSASHLGELWLESLKHNQETLINRRLPSSPPPFPFHLLLWPNCGLLFSLKKHVLL